MSLHNSCLFSQSPANTIEEANRNDWLSTEEEVSFSLFEDSLNAQSLKGIKWQIIITRVHHSNYYPEELEIMSGCKIRYKIFFVFSYVSSSFSSITPFYLSSLSKPPVSFYGCHSIIYHYLSKSCRSLRSALIIKKRDSDIMPTNGYSKESAGILSL